MVEVPMGEVLKHLGPYALKRRPDQQLHTLVTENGVNLFAGKSDATSGSSVDTSLPARSFAYNVETHSDSEISAPALDPTVELIAPIDRPVVPEPMRTIAMTLCESSPFARA